MIKVANVNIEILELQGLNIINFGCTEKIMNIERKNFRV